MYIEMCCKNRKEKLDYSLEAIKIDDFHKFLEQLLKIENFRINVYHCTEDKIICTIDTNPWYSTFGRNLYINLDKRFLNVEVLGNITSVNAELKKDPEFVNQSVRKLFIHTYGREYADDVANFIEDKRWEKQNAVRNLKLSDKKSLELLEQVDYEYDALLRDLSRDNTYQDSGVSL